ncbi:MAG: division/cell wall cluster transcriptional repressor MraZ [Pseudomonadota bacterium]
MDRFVSSFRNRIDSKGRVSVPAPFRAILARDGTEGVYVYPALGVEALDGGGNRLMDEINRLLDALPPYSEERDQLSTALLGDCEQLKLDGEGRIVLSDTLKAHAGIGGDLVFVGVGHKFQIWEPERFAAHQAEARDKARELRRLLGAGHRASVSSEAREP